jgi:2-polyprenyl-3-methyl-5-hydroxy-6-metoxy-1,4-benzoquinol methylase
MISDSSNDDYADYLHQRSAPLWKRVLNVQAPYRWNLRRLKPGYMLEVGCGIGRNLSHIDGNGVGVDPNKACVRAATLKGLTAYTDVDFATSPHAAPHSFDSLLVSHVLEHMSEAEAEALLAAYVGFVKPGGKIILITPQELGFATDPTHVNFADFACMRGIAGRVGMRVVSEFSFPFPRTFGKFFRYNEFVLLAEV